MSRVVLAGGGLANSLIAWRLRTLRPEVEVLLLEQGETLGGNHTWSFHASDLSAAQQAWMRPLVVHDWPGQTVRFPGLERRLRTRYCSVTSSALHATVGTAVADGIRLSSPIGEVRPDGVTLESGEIISAQLVIDGRGAPDMRSFDLRWQKFLGQEVELAAPHGLDVPLLMDATVMQRDGYRFIYVLPLGPRRLLVEDTRYSETPELRSAELRTEISRYLADRGMSVTALVREETGVLPIVLDGDFAGFWRRAGSAPRSGMAAMLFHHTTGYSLPDAARLADLVAECPQLDSASVAAVVREYAGRRWTEQRFFRLLNRLMFEAASPVERYRTLRHFYRKPEALIARFYAGRLQRIDCARLLFGRPPVPLGRALACVARGWAPGTRARGAIGGSSA